MNYKLIQYLVKESAAYIYLNRPDKRNAFNEQLVNELKLAYNQALKDDSVKTVILGGRGKVFSAGADLAYLHGLQKNTYEENLTDSMNLKELYQTIYTFPKVTIAMVQGHAIAGGAGLATVCDFTFAVPEALFGYTEVKIGFIPAIVMVFLLRKIGEGKAKELLLTGKLIKAQEALDMGLITALTTMENLDNEVHAFAMDLVKNSSSQSLTNTKQMMNRVQEMGLKDAFDYAAEMNARGRENEDCKKGINAFLNKEKIIW